MISEISMSKPDHTVPHHSMGVGTFRVIKKLLRPVMVRRPMISEISMSRPVHTVPPHPMGVGILRIEEPLVVTRCPMIISKGHMSRLVHTRPHHPVGVGIFKMIEDLLVMAPIQLKALRWARMHSMVQMTLESLMAI